METMGARSARAVFFYGATCEGPCAPKDKEKPVAQYDINDMVAALEQWNRISDDTRTTYQQWKQCANVQDGERLRTQVMRDMTAWAKAKIGKA